MSHARVRTLARLQSTIDRLDSDPAGKKRRVPLGHREADAALQSGLAIGAVHEVFAEGHHSAAATGFIGGLAQRITARRPMLWVRQDFAEIESGALSMSGWRELGFDPRLLVTVRTPDAGTALRVAADALACDALGAVVLEVWGDARPFDLVASRKLTLTARASGVTGLLLRVAATPMPSTAETRWIVRATHSPPVPDWGAPVLDAQLVRNRHGPTGHWIMEWKCDECLFRDASPYSQSVAAAPADRSYQAADVVQLRANQHAAADRGRETEQRVANRSAG